MTQGKIELSQNCKKYKGGNTRKVIDLCLDMPLGAEELASMLSSMCLDPQYRGYTDIKKGLGGVVEEISESFSVLGNRMVERIDCCPKPTLVAAKGRCIGGSTAMFNAFDIRIVGEGFRMHDGDIYYGTVGSWGMSSLRLPMWIGRNKVLDYMFLNEDFTGRQCYELGLASKVVADELLDEVAFATAKKMSKAAPIAVKYYKDCVRKATQNNIEEARALELKAAEIVFATEDSKRGLQSVVEDHGVPNCEFYGR